MALSLIVMETVGEGAAFISVEKLSEVDSGYVSSFSSEIWEGVFDTCTSVSLPCEKSFGKFCASMP